MIEKSLTAPRKKKVKGQLHKLAYITDKEAKLLQKFGGQKVMTPEKIPAYPPPGEKGGPGSGAEGRSPGGRDGGGGGAAAQAAASAAAAAAARSAAAEAAAKAKRDMQATIAKAEKAEAAKAPTTISGGESMARFGTPVYAGMDTKVADDIISRGEGQVDVGFQKALAEKKIADEVALDTKEKFISQQYMEPPDIYGDADLEGQKEIDDIRAQRQLQFSPNLSKDKQKALEIGLGLRDPKQSGIGTILKNVALGVVAPQLLAGTALAKPYNLYRQYQTAKRYLPKGVQEKIQTAFKPNLTTGTRKINPLVASDKDGQRVKTVAEKVATGQGLESGAKLLGVQNTQKAELFKRRSMVEDVLRKGSYQGRDLTSGQKNNLRNYIEQINKFLVPVQQGI